MGWRWETLRGSAAAFLGRGQSVGVIWGWGVEGEGDGRDGKGRRWVHGVGSEMIGLPWRRDGV